MKFLDSLAQSNYFFTELKDVKKKGDTTEIFYNKGKNYNETYVELSDSIVQKLKIQKDFFTKSLDSTKRALTKDILMKAILSAGSSLNLKARKMVIPL